MPNCHRNPPAVQHILWRRNTDTSKAAFNHRKWCHVSSRPQMPNFRKVGEDGLRLQNEPIPTTDKMLGQMIFQNFALHLRRGNQNTNLRRCPAIRALMQGRENCWQHPQLLLKAAFVEDCPIIIYIVRVHDVRCRWTGSFRHRWYQIGETAVYGWLGCQKAGGGWRVAGGGHGDQPFLVTITHH